MKKNCSKNILNICESINKPIYGKHISYFEFLDLLIYISLLYSILTFPPLFAWLFDTHIYFCVYIASWIANQSKWETIKSERLSIYLSIYRSIYRSTDRSVPYILPVSNGNFNLISIKFWLHAFWLSNFHIKLNAMTFFGNDSSTSFYTI